MTKKNRTFFFLLDQLSRDYSGLPVPFSRSFKVFVVEPCTVLVEGKLLFLPLCLFKKGKQLWPSVIYQAERVMNSV